MISGQQHSLLVDSGQYPVLARQMVEQIAANGIPPVRYLVSTHWHGGHLLANVFTMAWPQLVVIQHRETQRHVHKNHADWTEFAGPRAEAALATAERMLDSGNDANGQPLRNEQRQQLQTRRVLRRLRRTRRGHRQGPAHPATGTTADHQPALPAAGRRPLQRLPGATAELPRPAFAGRPRAPGPAVCRK